MLRIWLMAMLAAALLMVVRSYDLAHRSGLLSSCSTIQAPAGHSGDWQSCRRGLLNGRPDLASERCQSKGRAGSREYWRCPAPRTYASSAP
jgi:hypothetical protein